LVAALVEERAADGALEHEPALLCDAPARGVLRDDHEMDTVVLLRRSQVIDQELDGLGQSIRPARAPRLTVSDTRVAVLIGERVKAARGQRG
jgi:hypothetical protein